MARRRKLFSDLATTEQLSSDFLNRLWELYFVSYCISPSVEVATLAAWSLSRRAVRTESSLQGWGMGGGLLEEPRCGTCSAANETEHRQ